MATSSTSCHDLKKQSHWPLSVCKDISEALEIQWATVRTIIHTWRSFSFFPGTTGRPKLFRENINDSSGRSRKNSSPHLKNCKPHRVQLRSEVKLQWWEKDRAKMASIQRWPKQYKGSSHICQETSGRAPRLLGNILWTDETKAELSGRFEGLVTSAQQQSVVVWRSGLRCCCNWGNHELCSRPQNPEGGCPSVASCSKAQEHLGNAMIWNTPVGPPLNGSKAAESQSGLFCFFLLKCSFSFPLSPSAFS